MMHQPLIATRLSRPDDSGDLTDLDVKSFEIAWSAEKWYELVRASYKSDDPRTVILATYYGNTIGFTVVKANGGQAVIEKLAIKEQFRRKGAARRLLHDVMMRAEDMRLTSVALIMPESFIYPNEDGELSPAVKWAKAVGLRATTPFLPKHFTGYGTTEDGVKFVAPLNNATPTS